MQLNLHGFVLLPETLKLNAVDKFKAESNFPIMITAQNLVKRYGNITAVNDISFELHKGETFGLLGPNGAGKTTTINMMVGVLKPDSGAITLNGSADPTQPEVRRQLGNAPQSLALYEELTAEENLKFFGKMYDLAGKKLSERVQWALEFAGLIDRRKSRVSAYSGGMKRRLNLACALVHDPPVLLLDEPTVGVDPQSRNAIFDSIEKLIQEGRTIVYTTHYMEEAQRLCDRVAIMDHGKILALDTVDKLIESHGGLSVIEGVLSAPPKESANLPGVIKGTYFRQETNRPLEAVAKLAASGCEFVTLNIHKADLEMVFLNLTGRSLRD